MRSEFRGFRCLENRPIRPEATDGDIPIYDDSRLRLNGIHKNNIIAFWENIPDGFLERRKVAIFLPDCDEKLRIPKDLLPQKFRIFPVSIRPGRPRVGKKKMGNEYHGNAAENRTGV